MNREYLIVAVEHELTAGSRSDANGITYCNRVTLVPGGARAFRPSVPDGRHRYDGIETAVTTGPPGEEIHVDDLGRVKLRFLWDRSGVMDDRSSAWARCVQMNLGGAMLLPRVGWEVPVAYVDGNPDRPFVLGRMYNATAIGPYALPGAAATTSLQSATSPGGGSTNEIRMGDAAGRQEMFLHASKDQTVSVGGNAHTTVSGNEAHDVGLAYELTVTGAQSATIGGFAVRRRGDELPDQRRWRAHRIDWGHGERSRHGQSHRGGIGGVRRAGRRLLRPPVQPVQHLGPGRLRAGCRRSHGLRCGPRHERVGRRRRTELVGGVKNIVAAGPSPRACAGRNGRRRRPARGGERRHHDQGGRQRKHQGRRQREALGDRRLRRGGTDDHGPGGREPHGRSPQALRRGAQGDERHHQAQGNDQAPVGSQGPVMEASTKFMLAVEGLDPPWFILRLAGCERIHAPFSFEVTCVSPGRDEAPIDPEALVARRARLTWPSGDGGERIVLGLVDRAEAVHEGYRIVIVPPLAELADVVDHRSLPPQGRGDHRGGGARRATRPMSSGG